MGSEEQGEKTRLIHAFAPGRHGQGRCGNRCAANETKTIERNQKATIAFHRAKRQGKSMNVFAKMVATLVRNEGVAGSNPATPTMHFQIAAVFRPFQHPAFASIPRGACAAGKSTAAHMAPSLRCGPPARGRQGR